MSKDYTAVLDFGTSSITVAVGMNTRNGLVVVGSGEVSYGGYLDGEFIEIDKLGESIKKAITIAENNSNIEISSLTVGVPTAFATIMSKEVVQNYSKKIRVSEKVIDGLCEMGNDFSKYSTYTMISSDVIEISLDDGVPTLSYIGKITGKIKATISYVLVENKFANLISEIMKILGYDIDSFVCDSLAEYKYLVKPSLEPCVIIDCGHLSTNIAVCKGGAIQALAQFSLGGGFITSDLMRWLKLDYNTSELLKRKVVLSIIPGENDFYELKVNDEFLTLPAYSVNGIVENRVDIIGKNTLKCIEKFKPYINENTKFYLCGGGISYIKGAKEKFARIIGRNISILCPDLPQLARPHYSSILSLLYVACKNKELNRKFLFFKF